MGQIIVSAADCVTAKLVEEAGFDGIWISGFEASARLGLADNGSITMTEMLNIAKPIVEAVKIPVYVDTDTGYGNFKRTVREFEKIGVAGICVEDNLPELKQNSLWGDKIPLMDMREFGEKIKSAGWENRKLIIMARTEALIRGYGFEEANKRLNHYSSCGADAVLPHVRDIKDLVSAEKYTPIISPIVPFVQEKWWRVKTAIVPTKLPEMTNKQLFSMGYDLVIWANQTERVKIKSTRECLKSLKENDCALHIEENLSATLDDMKGLMPDD